MTTMTTYDYAIDARMGIDFASDQPRCGKALAHRRVESEFIFAPRRNVARLHDGNAMDRACVRRESS